MDFEKISQLITAVMSAIAIFISILKGNKKTKTYEEIVEREELKAQKRIAKQCKKAKVEIDPKHTSENLETVKENVGLDNQRTSQIIDNIKF